MRGIKFRAWDKDNKEFVTDYDTGKYSSIDFDSDGKARVFRLDLTCHCNPDFACGGCADKHSEIVSVHVMQYTGLKDKDGVDIYEGDILIGANGRTVICTYQAPSFVLKEKLTHKTWFSFLRHPDENQFETVIGNIYENPELLESNVN